MILLLLFFLGSLRIGDAVTITSVGDVDDGSNDDILTTCKIADNVRSALHILDKMPADDNFVTDEVVLTTELRSALTSAFPGMDTNGIISSADDNLLFDLASMNGMLSNLGDLDTKNGVTDWANIDNALALRIGFEQLALNVEEDLDRRDYLSTWMAKLTTREVLTLSCGSQGTLTNDNRKTSKKYLDGCYTGLTNFEANANGAAGLYHCVMACRDTNKKFSLFTTSVGCKCSNNALSVASVAGTYDADCQGALERMMKTGLGEPILTEEALLFDINALGYPPVTHDDLISIEEVEILDGSSSIYIIALFKKVISLFKESGDGLALVDWKRWDSVVCDKSLPLNDRCLHDVKLAFSNTLPGFDNLNQGDASAFTTFKVMTTLSHKMELDSDNAFSEIEDDPLIKTGDPMVFPGGKMVDHVMISFDTDDREKKRFVLLRLENDQIVHLTEAAGDNFFGNFFPVAKELVKYPVTFTHRVIGRDTYLFVGCHDDTDVDKGAIKLFKMKEIQKDITNYAAYGAIEMDMVDDVTISTKVIGDMMYVQTIYPLLIVLDSPGLDVGQPIGCRVRVYRISKFINLIEQDSIDITERFTSLDYISLETGKFLILKSGSRMIMLELSSKGILSRTLKDNYPSFTVADAVQFGRLQDDAIISIRNADSTNYEIYDILGNKIDETAISNDYKVMKCISRDTITCYAARFAENQAHFEAFKSIQIYSKLYVAEDDITLTNWEASKKRIDTMFSTLTPIYTGLKDKQKGYLMNSGSIVPSGGNWQIANLKASSLIGVSGVLDGTSVKMNVVDPITDNAYAVNYTPNDGSSGTDCRDALEIKLDDVATKIGDVTTKTAELDSTFNTLKLDLSSTSSQTVTNAVVNVVDSNTISSIDKLTVEEFKATDGTTKSLSDIISKTFLKNDVQPFTGKKTFNELIKIENLETAELSDEGEPKVTVSPADCFVKNKDTTISTAQTFSNPVTINALKIEGDASIVNTDGHTILKEDLVPHSSITDGLVGHFSFQDAVTAVGLNSHIEGFPLTGGDAANMALKDSANTIDFDLTVNIADAPGNKASGTSILLEEGKLLNNVDLINKKTNAVRTSCEGCSDCGTNCANTPVQIFSPVTFEGSVIAPSMGLTSVNSKEFSKFIDETEFNNNQISITGIKTLTNVNANTLKASTFHELELDTLLTINSVQNVNGKFTFNKDSVYASIDTPAESPCVLVDGKDLCAIFKSDLEAVNQAESWIQSNSIDTDIKFNQLTIKSDADIEFDNLVNGMIVGDAIAKIVTDENKAFTITGDKTIGAEINLQSVSSSIDNSEVNIISGANTNTVSDFVNTLTTTEIIGPKTFSKAVSFEDIFTVGSAHINDLDVSHMLHCFVDKNSNDVTDIHVLHPVHYHTVSVPKLVVERDSVNFESYGTVPLDTSIETAEIFVGAASGLLNVHMTGHGISLDLGSNEAGKDAMLSWVIRDQENLSDMSLLEKRKQLNLLLNERYGLTMTSVEALTDLEALQTIARNPKVNAFDPSTDLALLDSNNVFCTADNNCIQNFNGGLTAASVQVTGDVKILEDKLVHNVNPSLVDADRISLTNNNNNVASKKFTSLSMDQTDGVFTGSLNIETSDGFVSSNEFSDKFLSTTISGEETQTLGGSLVMGAIQAQDITATQLQIDGQVYSISDVDSATYNLDEPLTFTELDVQHTATFHNKITVGGSVDGVIIEDLHDLLVTGDDIVVDDETTIAGTNRAQLELKGTKTLSSLTVDNLDPFMHEDGKLHPDFAYLPCTTSQQITGPLTGQILDTVETNVEDCSQLCRNRVDCYGISYLEAGSQCRLYGSYVQEAQVPDEGWESSVSFMFECCASIKALESDFFLSVLENDVITTSLNSDFWCFVNDNKIVHKSTGKVLAVEDGALVLSDVPRSSSNTATRTDEILTYELHENSEFKMKASSGLYINKDDPSDNLVESVEDLGLDTQNSISILLQEEGTTKWKAFMGGVIMNELVDGNIETRLLLTSQPQTMTGTLAVQGDMTVEDATLITPTISTLSHDDVTAVYNWNDATSTHEVSTPFKITGSSLTVTNLVSAAYDADLDDFIQLDTLAEDLKLLGTTTFTDVTIASTGELTVDGTVASQSISDMDTNLARNNVGSLPFTATNTFSSASLTTSGLTSSVDMTLTNSQIRGGEDVVDIRDKTILNDDDTATIQGTVNFNKILVSGGAVTMGNANLNEGGEILVPSAFIKATDSSIDLTAHNVGTLTALNAITFKGQVCGHDGEEFMNVFYKDGDQTITANLTTSGNVEVTGNLATTTINGFEPQNDLVFLDGVVSMDSDTTFTETLSITNAVVIEKVDGFNFIEKFRDSVAVADAANEISEKWTITSASEFEGTVDGSSTPDHHYINEQRVSDMNAACHLHDNIYAVKVSAQAEASVLCDFVSDLQDSYLSGQEVVYYRQKSSNSFSGKSFKDGVMKTTQDDEVYLFVMSDQDLEVYQIDGSTIQIVQTLPIVSTAPPKLQLVVDITVDDGFSFFIFVGSGVPADNVQMIKFSGASVTTSSITSMGSLSDSTTVSEVNLNYIVVLKHVLITVDTEYEVSLEGYGSHQLKECDENCANATPDVLLITGELPNYGVLPNSEMLESGVTMKSIQALSGHYVVAFNLDSLFRQKVVGILVFEKTAEGVFSRIKTMIDSTSSSRFQLAEFDAKLFLLSADPQFEMKEINIELETLVDRYLADAVNTKLQGQIVDLKVENEYGSGYGVSVLSNGNELLNMKYWGTDGLHITNHFKLDNFYQSIASTTAVVDSKVVYQRTLVGSDMITVLQGDLASQSTYVKFECAKPEIPVAWATAPV